MTTTDRKSYAVKAETFEQILDILLSMEGDVQAQKQSTEDLKKEVTLLTKVANDAHRMAMVAALTATGAVAFSAFSLYLR